MQWSTERAGDFLITTYLEDCEVGGCAKACSVQVGDPHGLPQGYTHLSLWQFTFLPRALRRLWFPAKGV